MSIIERALQRMKQEAAAAPTPAPAPVAPTQSEAVDRPSGHRAERRADEPVHVASVEAIAPMPCRDDRTVRIDPQALRAAGEIPPEQEERRLAEEYRLIKRPLLKAMAGDDATELGNIIVVTSALPGEGKTFTAVNLALSLALERNREVVLVDGDVAKRDITRLFGLDEEPGLLDAGGAAGRRLEDVILKSDLPSLYLLPAGARNAEATEILGSERMSSLLASLAAEPRRIVLIDSPPLLLTSEAGVIVAFAGQVVLVVKASSTPQEAVLRAIAVVPEEKSMRVVLNQAESVHGHQYGYYGGYAYDGTYGRAAAGPAVQDDRG